MNTLLKLVGIAVILLILTYINTVNEANKEKEAFASKNIPEFQWKSFEQHDKACAAAMKRCKTPFCMNLNTGKGPLMDCTKEYLNYFTKTNGLIPTYQSGDWSGFSL